MQQAIPDMDDMPAWLKEPAPRAAESGGAFAAFKRAAIFWGASVAALALVFAGTMWLFDEHGPERPMVLETMAAPAPAGPPPPPVRVSALPPLVLLSPAPDVVGTGTPAGPPAPVAAMKKPEKAAPLVAQLPPKAPAARPVLAKAAPKASAHPPRKAALAKTAPVQPKAKLASAKKSVVVAKRLPAPAPGKAKPRLLAAVMLPPARERGKEREPQRAAPAKNHNCLPGELARECEARQ